MDEVTNGLDYESLKMLQRDIANLKKNSIVLLTGHDFDFYGRVIDDLYVLSENQIIRVDNWTEKGGVAVYEDYFPTRA